MFKLRVRIVFFIGLLVLLICLGLGVNSYYTAANLLDKSYTDTLSKVSTDAAQLIQSDVEKQYAVLQTLAADPVIQDINNPQANMQAVAKILANVKESGKYLKICALNAKGQGIDEAGTVKDFSQFAYTRLLLEGKNYISDPTLINDTQLIMVFAIPIKSGNEVLGGVMIALDGYHLSDLMSNYTFTKNNSAFIINSQAKTIAHTDKSLVAKTLEDDKATGPSSSESTADAMSSATVSGENDQSGFKGFTELQKKMAGGEAGYGEYSYKGTQKYIGYTPIADYGWSVGIEVNKSELLSKLAVLKTQALIISLGFMLLGSLVAFFIAVNVEKPISFLTKKCNDMAAGDFSSVALPKYGMRKDEIGELARSFSKINANVSEIIRNVMNEVGNVSSLASNSEDTVIQLENMIKQVADVTAEISTGMEQTAIATEKLSRSSEEIESAAGTIASKAQDSALVANEISARADKVKTDFLTTQEIIAVRLNETRSKLGLALEKAKSVEKIKGLSAAILQITSQTNLLSLNATIEAARAGDLGKGFGVVAKEILKLADNSKQTATQIQVLAHEVISSVTSLSDSSNEMMEFVATDVIRDYEVMLEVLEQYTSDIVLITNSIEEFSANSEEIFVSIGEVIKDVGSISTDAQSGAAGTATIAQQLESIVDKTNNVSEQALYSKKSVDKLADTMQKFTVAD